MVITRAELQRYRGQTLPDLVGPDLRLLFVGINPGLRAVAVGAPFGGGSNRFYPALFQAGITRSQIVASNGLRAEDLAELHQRGVGITSLVARASARADELDDVELIEGAALLAERVRMLAPTVVAMLGITAYRTAFARPKAIVGRQTESLGGVPAWVVPNPSGLNAHAPLPVLAAAYREVAIAAGITVYDPPQ